VPNKENVGLRPLDDKIIESILILDKSLKKLIEKISEKIPKFACDFLFASATRPSTSTGGVKIFSNSRKKEYTRLSTLQLISVINKPKLLTREIKRLGLVRGVQEELIISFIEFFKKDWKRFLLLYGDPFPVYREIFPIYCLYTELKSRIIYLTFFTLARSVVLRYKSWGSRRSIKSKKDHIDVEEDLQNSLFSVQKAFSLFNPKLHKSFFSYVTFWTKHGIESSEYSIKDERKVTEDESGRLIPILLIPLEESTQKIEELNSDFEESDSERENELNVLNYLTGSFPLPNEVRIFYHLRNLLDKEKHEDQKP